MFQSLLLNLEDFKKSKGYKMNLFKRNIKRPALAESRKAIFFCFILFRSD